MNCLSTSSDKENVGLWEAGMFLTTLCIMKKRKASHLRNRCVCFPPSLAMALGNVHNLLSLFDPTGNYNEELQVVLWATCKCFTQSATNDRYAKETKVNMPLLCD